jgi:hypothetical protein
MRLRYGGDAHGPAASTIEAIAPRRAPRQPSATLHARRRD